MPPILALTLCTIFVLFLLRLDRKQAPEVSFSLWIPTIWMLHAASKPLGVWFRYGANVEGSILDRIFLSSLLCLCLFMLVRRKYDWSIDMKEHIWLFLLIGYMLVSILWSDIPFISFKRWIREIIAVVMAFLVLSEPDPRQAIQSIFRRTIYIMIPFSLLLIKYYPEYGVDFGRWSGVRMWIGVTTQKNGLGRLCIIAAFFLIWSLVKRRRGHDISVTKYQTYAEVLVLFITLWLLKGPPGAYSATAIGAFAMGLSAFVYLLWKKRHRINLGATPFVAMLALGIAFGIATVFLSGSTLEPVTDVLGRDATLTGRTDIWLRLLPVAMERSIVGHGFGGFWTNTTREVYHISEGHSGYLDVILDLGFFGLMLFSMFLLSSCRKAQKELDHDFYWGSLWICYLLMAVVHNITESSLNTFTSQIMAVLLFLAVSSTASTSST